MKNFLRISLALVILSVVFTSENIQNDIMDSLQSHDIKTQFKAYHVVYKKTYDLNSEEGIRRYKIFKQNVKEINEHNASDSSYKQGINHLTDMTVEEVNKFYNLVPMTGSELKNKLRGLGLFDDYVDEDEESPKSTGSQVTERTPIDHRSHMTTVRNQGGCGSCWAFTTMSTVEGCWNKNHTKKEDQLSGWLSTQHLVDCDKSNNGCNGGWYTGALTFLKNNKAIYDKVYPYTARKGICQTPSDLSPVQLTGFAWSNNTGYGDDANWVKLLNNGPVAVAIDANSNFQRYRSGIWSGPCSSKVNHAVTLVGYGEENGTAFYWVRNSWGMWGDKGHIRMKVDKTNQTCNLEKYAYQPSGFTS
jgi:C1A family cysteine protease